MWVVYEYFSDGYESNQGEGTYFKYKKNAEAFHREQESQVRDTCYSWHIEEFQLEDENNQPEVENDFRNMCP